MRAHLLTAAVAFGLGVAVTLLATGGPAPRSDRTRLARDREEPSATRALEESEARNAVLEELLRAAAPEQPPEAADRPARAPAPPGQSTPGPRFVYADAGKALFVMDWDATGKALATIMPLLSEAGEVVHGRRALRPELWGEVTLSMAPLITEAMKLEQAGLVEEVWNHPAVLVNSIHATLKHAGKPLDRTQEEELYRIGLRFVEEDARRRAGYGEGTLRLRRRIDESRLHDRLHDAVRPVLDDGQRAVLYPPNIAGIVPLDAFSGAALWDEHWKHLKHSDREELRERFLGKHMEELGRKEAGPVLARLVAEWEASMPDAFVFAEPDTVRISDMDRTDRVLEAASRQAAFYEAVLAQAPLTGKERGRILEYDRVLVPLLER